MYIQLYARHEFRICLLTIMIVYIGTNYLYILKPLNVTIHFKRLFL